MDARFYNSEEIDIERLAIDLENVYRSQGYQVQQIGNKDQVLVQLKKGGDFEALIGMQAALSVTIQRTAGGTLAMIGQQKWIDKAAVGAVGIVAMPVLWPLMVTAGVGALRQASLGNQVLNVVDGLVRQQRPGTQVGPVPVQIVPQVQQQYAPPPQYIATYAPPQQYLPSPPVAAQPQPVAPLAPAKLRCPNCNTPYEAGDTFCTGCGKPLVPPKKFCTNCKAELKNDAAFCPNCGASTFHTLTSTQSAPAPSMPTHTPPAAPVQPTVPKYTPPVVPPNAAPTVASTPQPAPQPYVSPVPQEPPVIPQPKVTIIPAAPRQDTPAAPKQPPQMPTYTPPPMPTYSPPVQPRPVTPKAQTPPSTSKPIVAKPVSQSAFDPTAPWGSLTFSNGTKVELSGERALVGRVDHDLGEAIQPEVDLSTMQGSDTVSRIHAVIEHIGSTYTVTDLNSTNSTRLNGKRLEPDKATPINDGDALQFGKAKSTFKKV